MKLIKMQCPNCHAGLEIDIEHLQAYCPYCGTKLLFDFDQMNQIITEKEKTKRLEIMQNAEVSKAKIQRIVEIFKSPAGIMIAFFAGIALLFLVLLLPFFI